MAKSLGQLHIVNYSTEELNFSSNYLIDASSALSQQLQRNVRQMSTFKCTGINIDMTCNPDALNQVDQFLVKGKIKYFAPTRGRVAAMKGGYSAVMRAMKAQGITRNNRLYDFRVTPKEASYYAMDPPGSDAFVNLATLNGTDQLSLLDNPPASLEVTSLFDAHNSNIQPLETGTPTFGGGLSTMATGSLPPNDFVLNEGLIHEGRTMLADTNFEYIPFTVEYDPMDTGKSALQFEWQPDPQLYLSVLGGWFEIEFDDLAVEFDMPHGIFAKMDIAIEIAGWKSILGGKSRVRKSKKSKKSSKKAKKAKK